MPIAVLARNPTDSFIHGLLPALIRTGLGVRLLTDHPGEHAGLLLPAGLDSVEILGCEVTRLDRVLAMIGAGPRPAAVFSNSDHLQVQTALAADYLGLPGKDWRSAARARDKGLMRATLRAAGLEDVGMHRLSGDLPSADGLPAAVLAQARFPVVLKPADGVAGEDVVLVGSAPALVGQVDRIRAHRRGDLLVEELLVGQLRTLETLGDGDVIRVLGGYRTTVSPPPAFIEQRLTWDPDRPAAEVDAVLARLRALGAGFGACHTEYVVTAEGPRLVEVNDRLIGDNCDFELTDLLGEPLFDQVVALYLGAAVPPAAADAPARAGAVHWLLARRDGVLTGMPAAGSWDAGHPEVTVYYHPIRVDGDTVRVTGSNRDYLGSIRVVGPDDGTVERVLAGFLAAHPWMTR